MPIENQPCRKHFRDIGLWRDRRGTYLPAPFLGRWLLKVASWSQVMQSPLLLHTKVVLSTSHAEVLRAHHLALTDCAGIIFGIIHEYGHTFHRFPEQSTASKICAFGQFWSTKLSSIDHATNYFGPSSELHTNLSNKINFLSAYCQIQGTWTRFFPIQRLNACA